METRQQQRNRNPDHHHRGKFCRCPSPSLRQPFPLKSLVLLLTAASLLAQYPPPPCRGQTDYADASEQSLNEFKAVQESAAATKSTLDATKIVIDKAEAHPREPVLQLDDLCALDDRRHMTVDGVSFEVRAGEILGIAGV